MIFSPIDQLKDSFLQLHDIYIWEEFYSFSYFLKHLLKSAGQQ